MKKGQTIVVCSSVSFYNKVLEIEKQLKKLEFKVIIPKTARKMKRNKDFDAERNKTWYKNPKDYHRKTKLISAHLQEVARGDAVLVVNNSKKGIEGYIGGNTLMEMTVAFFLKKPIYVLNKIDENLSTKEEVFGMGAIFLNGEVEKIKD